MGDGAWVNGVWCAGLRPVAARPASAPVRPSGAKLAALPADKRPASAPAVPARHVRFADAPETAADADLELPWGDYAMPTSELPGGLTAPWLTGLLYRSGHLRVGSGVIVARVLSITDVYEGNGLVYRINVAYGGPRKTLQDNAALDLPSAFILKLYDNEELLPNAQRELLFYTKLAARTPGRVPRCFWAKQKPRCGAVSRCPPERWPSIEEFLVRWCELSDEPVPWDESMSQTGSSMSSSMTESSWGDASAWDPDGSPRFRPSTVEKYSKLLRSANITNISQLGRLHRFVGVFRSKGMKQQHIMKMLEERHSFEPRAVTAALLLEDLGPTPSSMRADGLPPARPNLDSSPANVQLSDAKLIVEAAAKVHAAWWNSDEMGKHAALRAGRAYNTNGPDWRDDLEELWPALSRYLHKFRRLKKRFRSAADVQRWNSRPLTLQHGDLHPANAVVTKDGSGDGQSAALFDWAEINVSSGPEELGHFLVRSSFYTDGEGAERLAPKEVAGQLLELYYRVITRNGVLAPTYPYNVMLEHVSLGVLGSAVRLVQHLEELRAAHPLGPEPFGAPRWVLEGLRTRISLLNLLQANC